MLPNLNELVNPIAEKIERFNMLDCALPTSFTSAVTTINRDSVQFGNSSSCVTNRNGQRIFMSNNWFYIAAILAPLHEPFYQYKKLLNQIVDKEVLKQSDSERIRLAVNSRTDIDELDKEYLLKFALEPLWWNGGNSSTGGKTLDRNDALVSAVLSIAKLVNASQSYVATLWEFFGEHPEYALLLNEASDNILSNSVSPAKAIYAKESKQTIFYGSPGTGKSWTVQNDILDGVKDDFIFRTTFHPDTDYSAFVGCYKPLKTKVGKTDRVLSAEDLAAIYVRDVVPTEHLKTGHIEPRIKFGIEYCEYFGGSLGKYDINNVLELAGIELATGCLEDRVGMTYVKYGVSVGLKLDTQKNTGTITYDFVPQVFTEAYIKAWQNPTELVYLVIEEINRGNCAQIFGDLFQLLDRKKGVSEYPVKAETALAEYLSDVLEGEAAEGIRDGKLSLPANLNIIATMNTSDQSLFPMDSAFKRRWDWKYIPTTPPADKSRTMELSFKDKTTTKYGTTIDAGDYEYDWTEFLEKINEKIQNATHSDDKQLGFWFVKTEEGAEEITISSFVSKVVFYLWNDVFKDMGAKDNNPFTIKVDGKNVVMSFNSFFEMNSFGQIVENIGVLHTFLRNVGVEPKVKKAITDAQDAAQAKEMTEEA